MDRRVKERLVGATILVLLIVLVVPELLSGPKPTKSPVPPEASGEPWHNVTVDLATSKATPEPDPVVAPAVPIAPATAPSAPSPAEGASPPAAAGSPAGTPPVAPSAAPTAIATLQAQHSASTPLENGTVNPKSTAGTAADDARSVAGHWAVQVGSFASQTNADRLLRQLKSEGFATYVIAGGAGRLYRVRVGPLPDRASAERTISRLSKVGHSASVVSP